MPSFIARVELHAAKTFEDYERLHTAMARRRFYRTITSDEGIVCQLPTGTYYLEGYVTIWQANQRVKDAIAEAGEVGIHLVSEATTFLWTLHPIE